MNKLEKFAPCGEVNFFTVRRAAEWDFWTRLFWAWREYRREEKWHG
jgi:hypothetical protein